MHHHLRILLLVIGLSYAGFAADANVPGKMFSSFKDCAVCPEMVLIPGGVFMMGDATGVGTKHEVPAHKVTIQAALGFGKFEITFGEWDICVTEGGCTYRPSDVNWGRGLRPIGNVNWFDAQEYVKWLSNKTGAVYRLPTEAEWEYAARAGSVTQYPWGDEFGERNAVCLSCGSGFGPATQVGTLPPNRFGLFDMIGLHREWVEDCWQSGYEGTPDNGSAHVGGNCDFRVTRGGNWYDSARYLRSASRSGVTAGERTELIGFRVVRQL